MTKNDLDGRVERIARSSYLTFLSRMAVIVGLPVVGALAGGAWQELKDNTRELIRIQTQIEAMVAVNDDQTVRIYRLEGTLLGARGGAN